MTAILSSAVCPSPAHMPRFGAAPHPGWAEDGRDWPNRAQSRFVSAAGLIWHVQRAGSGPVVLLLHGTGAATHSWRDLLPLLARRFNVVAPDLPGHGFTAMPRASLMGLPGMARGLSALLERLGVRPDLVVGHSAGAVIAARLCLDGAIDPDRLLSLNGALLPPPGLQATVFPAAARFLAGLPLLPLLVARTASDARVEALLRDTGSVLDSEGLRFYRRLFRRPDHVAGAVTMMARWDLRGLPGELRRLGDRLVLAAGDRDGMIPAEAARIVHDRVPGSRLVALPGLGHLAHEEAPERIAALIADLLPAAPP
ncbi:alpha/beta fold hydrolase [Acetobacteraceae bacterium KSS8]|uniref:Alpha/beta fold hydrolase n=1 Tax=Endosaccharibacter trunci TaxID=2812733 RepID=A0ABT1W3N6_9PROT|nr:alpha/beta fold hydrolase [Acetobacteraceae bacterium KSS8]